MEFFRPKRKRRQSFVKSAVPAARRAQSPQTMAGSNGSDFSAVWFPVFQMNPYDFTVEPMEPVEQWLDFLGIFAKAVGLIAGDLEKKNLFHDFSSACLDVLCPNTNTKTTPAAWPKEPKKVEKMATKVSSHEKMLLKLC